MIENQNQVFIYSLSYPEGNVRYIGKSINMQQRLEAHLSESKTGRTKKNKWMRELATQNQKPSMEIVDIVSEKDWSYWEQFYIELFKSWNFDLVNTSITTRHYDINYISDTKNIKIDDKYHKMLKEFCDVNGLKMFKFVEKLIEQYCDE
jgi:hypothetical protein